MNYDSRGVETNSQVTAYSQVPANSRAKFDDFSALNLRIRRLRFYYSLSRPGVSLQILINGTIGKSVQTYPKRELYKKFQCLTFFLNADT